MPPLTDLGLDDRVAVVIGASRGIGRATAELFEAQMGSIVVGLPAAAALVSDLLITK